MIDLSINSDPLKDLLEMILKRKILVVLGFLIVFIMSIAGAAMLPPVYRAHTKIYINRPPVPNIKVPYINEMGGGTFFGNQREIMRSRIISEKVVRKLGMVNRPQPSIKSKIKSSIYNLIGIQQTIPDPFEDAILSLNDSISIHFTRGTNIVTISAVYKTPNGAATLANTFAQTYIEYANSLLFNKAQSAYRYIEEEVEKARMNMAKSEKAVTNFKENEMMFSVKSDSDIIFQKLAELQETKQKIQQQIEMLNNNLTNIKENKKQIGISQDDNDYAKIKELRSRINQLKTKLDELLGLFTEEHPDVKTLKATIEKLEKQLSQNINVSAKGGTNVISQEISQEQIVSKIRGLNVAKNRIDNEIEKITTKHKTIVKNQLEMEKLNREFLQDKQKLSVLITKLENAKILKANEMKSESIRILDIAYPPTYPHKKKKIILIMIGILAGSVFGIGMAFLAEYLNNTFETIEDTQAYLDILVLGSIPKITRKMRKT